MLPTANTSRACSPAANAFSTICAGESPATTTSAPSTSKSTTPPSESFVPQVVRANPSTFPRDFTAFMEPSSLTWNLPDVFVERQIKCRTEHEQPRPRRSIPPADLLPNWITKSSMENQCLACAICLAYPPEISDMTIEVDMGNINSGKWLRQRWESMGYSASGIARSSNISRRTLERIAGGGRVTEYTASRLAGLLKLSDAQVRALSRSREVDEDLM